MRTEMKAARSTKRRTIRRPAPVGIIVRSVEQYDGDEDERHAKAVVIKEYGPQVTEGVIHER
jgi:hypothetical protein